MTALRIGYVATADPRDRWSWSGTHHYMYEALAARAVVEPLVPAPPPPTSRLARLVARVTGGPPPQADPMTAARQAAARLDEMLAGRTFDVLFAPVASTVSAHRLDQTPLALLSDATFRLIRADYPEVRALPEAEAAAREELERLSIARADLLIYPSQWAADSAVRDYGADPARVRVIGLGANLDDVPAAAAALGSKRQGPLCRLVFIGRDWVRKGGAVAVAAAAALARRGIATELTLVGSAPPGDALPAGVVALGNLDKKRPRDQARLRALLEAAHFLILPTRADCYSMVSCEANAFAVPVAISAVGGITSLIEDGGNGLLLPRDAGGEQYAAAIAAVWSDPARYAALVRGARAAYDTRLNWGAWGLAVHRELAALAASRARTRRVA